HHLDAGEPAVGDLALHPRSDALDALGAKPYLLGLCGGDLVHGRQPSRVRRISGNGLLARLTRAPSLSARSPPLKRARGAGRGSESQSSESQGVASGALSAHLLRARGSGVRAGPRHPPPPVPIALAMRNPVVLARLRAELGQQAGDGLPVVPGAQLVV